MPPRRGGWHHGGVDYLLAQVNIGRMREPLDSPLLADFVAALDPVNAVADTAPGFVWRLQTEDGNATAVHAFEWDRAGSAGVLVNLPRVATLLPIAGNRVSQTPGQDSVSSGGLGPSQSWFGGGSYGGRAQRGLSVPPGRLIT